MSDPDAISLREYFDAELRHLREYMDEQFKARDAAITIQTPEIERRLSILNHENERIAAAASKSVSIDTWNAERRAIGDALQRLELQSQKLLLREEFEVYKQRQSEIASETAIRIDAAAIASRRNMLGVAVAIGTAVLGWILRWVPSVK